MSLNGIDTSLQNLTGTLEWNPVHIEPGTQPPFPTEVVPNRYYAARGTDAAPLAVGDQHEKFLFYRGVGTFPIPLSARVEESGKITVANLGGEAVPSVILFENRGGHIGYRMAGTLGKEGTLDAPWLDTSFLHLRQDLEAALVSQGLYPKEAHAMVETWRDSWFEEGSRLIYLVPRATVDTILPLQVEPAPSEIARVFVGRIELLTPETKRTVAAAVKTGDWQVVARYQRFLTAILGGIFATDPASRKELAPRCGPFGCPPGGSLQVTIAEHGSGRIARLTPGTSVDATDSDPPRRGNGETLCHTVAVRQRPVLRRLPPPKPRAWPRTRFARK